MDVSLGLNQSFVSNTRIAYFKNPDNKIAKISNKGAGAISEIFGTHHIKAHVFDNNLLITGANLSNDYFTNRCDRYYIFQDCQELCDFYDDLLNFISNCSQFEEFQGGVGPQKKFPNPDTKGLEFKKVLTHHLRFFRFANKFTEKEFCQEDVEKEMEQIISYARPKKTDESRPTLEETKSEQFEVKTEELFMGSKFEGQKKMQQFKEAHKQNAQFLTEYDRQFEMQMSPQVEKGFVYIFPTLQIPCIQYHQDEEFLLCLLEDFSQGDQMNRMTLASGYLNLSKSYIQILQKQKQKLELITASPRANGFYRAGRVKSYIPYFYRQYELDLLKRMENMDLYEYKRKKWTYHAKGLWLFTENNQNPSMTVIGSSNFSKKLHNALGERSLRRDTESQLYLFSNCPHFDAKMKKEIELMKNWSELMSREKIKTEQDVKLTAWTKGLSRVFKSFL